MPSRNSSSSKAREAVQADKSYCHKCSTVLPVSELYISGSSRNASGHPYFIYQCGPCSGIKEERKEVVSVTETKKTSPVSEEVCSDPIVEAVVKQLRSRSEAGLLKYGTTLERNDLTFEQWIQHTQEELMDAINYLERLKVGYKEASQIFNLFATLPK